MSDIDEHNRKREAAYESWLNGAKIHELAKILGVGHARAAQVSNKFSAQVRREERRKSKTRMKAALLLLLDNGYSEEEIRIFFGMNGREISEFRQEAEIEDGRVDAPFGLKLILSVRATRCLEKAGAVTVSDIEKLTSDCILKTQGCGALTLKEIEEELALHGLSLSG